MAGRNAFVTVRRNLSLVLLILLAALLRSNAVEAEKRVALVIGDAAYANAPRLANPLNDAKAVADRLKNAKLGTRDWLYSLSRADVDLYRHAYEEWEGLYTTRESFAMAAAFEDFCMQHELEWIRGRNSALDNMKQDFTK